MSKFIKVYNSDHRRVIINSSIIKEFIFNSDNDNDFFVAISIENNLYNIAKDEFYDDYHNHHKYFDNFLNFLNS